MVTTKLNFDRAGIFLLDTERNLLRGSWGVDDHVVSLFSEFPLYPEDPAELTQAAQIARGELAYSLTQDLDREGRKSVEGGIGANLCVPMLVGDRCIGVLAVDNYFTNASITDDQVQPSMILANQGGIALENARLFAALQEAHDGLERVVSERPPTCKDRSRNASGRRKNFDSRPRFWTRSTTRLSLWTRMRM